MSTKAQLAEREEAKERLREILQPGDTVYTVLRHVSRSGMSRAIDVYKLEDGEPMWLSRLAATAAGYRFSDRYEAVDMGGCGMDMGFALVYAVSRSLWPDGFDCIDPDRDEYYSRVCPSNDHVNCRQSRGDIVPTHHSEGGYALRQKWM